MEPKCDLIEHCPMFRYFCQSTRTVYRKIYCEGSYERCERRRLALAGRPVPERLFPHGRMRWDDR